MVIEFKEIESDLGGLKKLNKEKIELVEKRLEIEKILNQKKQELDFLAANLDISVEIDDYNKEFFLTIEPELTYDLKVYNQMFSFIRELPEGTDILTSAGFNIDNFFKIVLRSSNDKEYNNTQRIAFLYHTVWSNLFIVDESEADKDLDKWLNSNDLIVDYLIEKEKFIKEMYKDSYEVFKAQHNNSDSISNKTIEEMEEKIKGRIQSLFKVDKK